MQITKKRLKQIISEELERLNEMPMGDAFGLSVTLSELMNPNSAIDAATLVQNLRNELSKVSKDQAVESFKKALGGKVMEQTKRDK